MSSGARSTSSREPGGVLPRRSRADAQLRWLGPEKGVIHMAAGAISTRCGTCGPGSPEKPLWRLLAELPTEQLVGAVDFRHITDALTPTEALELLAAQRPGRAARAPVARATGFPAYTTSAGWLGYPDEKVRGSAARRVADGCDPMKMKVGARLDDDVRRAGLIREEIGPDALLMMDANQVWDVDEAIDRMRALARSTRTGSRSRPRRRRARARPDRRAPSRPIRVATGEVAANRVIFKQLLQADAIGVCRSTPAGSPGVNEVLAVLLLAAKFGVPVCPHAGGVGLCEYVQHLAIFDYLRSAARPDGRMVEYVDHLHELSPIRRGSWPVATGCRPARLQRPVHRRGRPRTTFPHGGTGERSVTRALDLTSLALAPPAVRPSYDPRSLRAWARPPRGWGVLPCARRGVRRPGRRRRSTRSGAWLPSGSGPLES